jgi:predicted phosphodiesterase
MKTIIISDLHNRVDWIEDALLSPLLQPYDKVIFLGDYFDDYNDTPEMAANAATWLKYSIRKPNRIHITGTHDLWYRFPHNRFITVSGNTETKAYAIRSIMTQEDWNRLCLYHYEQSFLLSHAGIHLNLISEYVFKHKNLFDKYIVNKELQLNGKEIVDKIVRPATTEALNRVKDGYAHPWLDAGIARGGIQPVGGIIWLDWRYEFKSIPGLNQIVGHTEFLEPQEKIIRNSNNYDLDTRNQHIGILENGEFRYIETIDILESI